MASDDYDIETLLQEHGLFKLSSKPNSVRPQKRQYANLVTEDELVLRVFGDTDRIADRDDKELQETVRFNMVYETGEHDIDEILEENGFGKRDPFTFTLKPVQWPPSVSIAELARHVTDRDNDELRETVLRSRFLLQEKEDQLLLQKQQTIRYQQLLEFEHRQKDRDRMDAMADDAVKQVYTQQYLRDQVSRLRRERNRFRQKCEDLFITLSGLTKGRVEYAVELSLWYQLTMRIPQEQRDHISNLISAAHRAKRADDRDSGDSTPEPQAPAP